ncbi:MAG: hypothetical protein NC393_09830 [Clostridium sp.]|nr:hypothetical protein [Clostridium sp.]MCM1172412.1 hypothetical protein [Clostridium sp.]MCM1208640.1 hypothetical protein [Ruminococcus sp.]
MCNHDTIELLKECDSGSKMAVSSIDEVLDKVESSEFRKLLTESREHHSKLGNDLHAILNEYGIESKEPNPMAKGMSWMKTNVKIGIHEGDETIADLMTEGCDMGIKSLNKYLNQYKAADNQARDICNRLISIEEELNKELRKFL